MIHLSKPSACLFLLALTIQTQAAKRHNILLFTADDLHAESLGVYGGKVPDLTPNLDRFAAQGMLFNRAHVNVAICAPCRAVIATGLLSHNSGAMGFMKARPDTPDIVTTLQGGGYLAGILGKVSHSTPTTKMKWDYSFDQKDLGNGRSPQLYYERSVAFFKRCEDEKKPFYFMVNSHDPHRPYCNPGKLTKGAEMPSRTYQPSEVEVPGFVPDIPGVREELAHYQNSTRRLDDTFGKVMQALEESGQAKNTIVIFMSDNGIAIPFAKCNTWFHSSRTPFLVCWPDHVKPGSRNDQHFVSAVDLKPTFLGITGVTGSKRLDGRSIVPLLHGKSQKGREFMFTQIDSKAGNDGVPMRCVQDSRFGYVYNPFSDGKHVYRNNNEGKTFAAMAAAAKTNPDIAARIEMFRLRVPEEFYDLEKDPNCLHNLIGHTDYQAQIAAYRKRLESWMKQTGDPMLAALQNKDDRERVNAVMLKTYGPPKPKKPKKNKKTRKRKN
ncbi:MAG: sulfatase family protein [Limisphaerales bacterium]